MWDEGGAVKHVCVVVIGAGRLTEYDYKSACRQIIRVI